jgi:hypothetical protein
MVQTCPVCRTPRGGRFCEIDGFDFVEGRQGANAAMVPSHAGLARDGDFGGAPGGHGRHGLSATDAGWEATIGADRTYYDEVIAQGGPDAAKIVFPPYCPQRSVALTGTQVRIGRRSRSRNLQPEIDLAGPPEDTGVSHLHAVLLAQPDGSWALLDPGSANGTQINGSPVPINVAVPLRTGDRVHIGAWTVITLSDGRHDPRHDRGEAGHGEAGHGYGVRP